MASETVLDRIDDAVSGWEARPESWLPGDPLHERPTMGGWFGQQTVRPMFEVLPEEYAPPARCVPCQVTWFGDEPCWLCGEECPDPTLRVTWGDVRALGSAPVVRFEQIELQPYVDVVREMSEQLASVYASLGETFRRMTLDRWTPERHRNGPEPLSIDGHGYRRRTRNRRGRR